MADTEDGWDTGAEFSVYYFIDTERNDKSLRPKNDSEQESVYTNVVIRF